VLARLLVAQPAIPAKRSLFLLYTCSVEQACHPRLGVSSLVEFPSPGSNLLAPSFPLIVQNLSDQTALSSDDCIVVADPFKQLGSALGQALDTLTSAASVFDQLSLFAKPVEIALRSAEAGVDNLTPRLIAIAEPGVCQSDITQVQKTLDAKFTTAIAGYTPGGIFGIGN
jgi:hypothetical protein